VIRWEEPPDDGRREPPQRDRGPRWKYPAIAAELRERPGEWALVIECAAGNTGYVVAHRMRRGACAGFGPAGAFEAEARQHGDGTRVYARFVGLAAAS
jgi:hypothetical protein